MERLQRAIDIIKQMYGDIEIEMLNNPSGDYEEFRITRGYTETRCRIAGTTLAVIDVDGLVSMFQNAIGGVKHKERPKEPVGLDGWIDNWERNNV